MNTEKLIKDIADQKNLIGVGLRPVERHFPANAEIRNSAHYWKGKFDALDELAQNILAGKYDS